MENQQPKAKQGFAAMTLEQRRLLASKGGRAAHEKGLAHQWNREEAKEAGKKGGLSSGKRRINRGENDGSDHFL